MSPPLDPREVEALFEAAIDQGHDRRRAFLEARCAGRPELFQEVWSLLQHDGAAQDGFLEGSAVVLSAHDEPLRPGARVGRFTVLSEVGQGGMGVVYAAYDAELDRRVALKLIAPGVLDPEGRARLVREAQVMARLSHPNVVPIYEIGEHGRGVFVAMEFVDGRTLRGFKSDQWSFCATVYEALYGELPFEGGDLQERLDRARRGLLRPPPPGSKVPPWVRGALARGLRARPEERWPRLDDLLKALSDQLAKTAELDLKVSRRERVRFGIVLGALGVAMAVIGLGRLVPVVRPVHLLGMGCVSALVGFSLLRLFRHAFSKNAVNQRIGHVAKVLLGVMLFQRALAVVTDEPVERTVATSLLLFAAVYAAAAPGLPRTSWLSAALCGACAVCAAIFPEHAGVFYVVGVLGSLTNAIVAWHRD